MGASARANGHDDNAAVASHAEPHIMSYYYNATPPVEFYARGVRVEVATPGAGTSRNSFAAPCPASEIRCLIRSDNGLASGEAPRNRASLPAPTVTLLSLRGDEPEAPLPQAYDDGA